MECEYRVNVQRPMDDKGVKAIPSNTPSQHLVSFYHMFLYVSKNQLVYLDPTFQCKSKHSQKSMEI